MIRSEVKFKNLKDKKKIISTVSYEEPTVRDHDRENILSVDLNPMPMKGQILEVGAKYCQNILNIPRIKFQDIRSILFLPHRVLGLNLNLGESQTYDET